jgi:18S rRNA (guanine1575-N7)-methyltransferase
MGKKAKERPEHTAPPEIFYDADEAAKYTANTRVAAVQRRLTERALELLALPARRRSGAGGGGGGGGGDERPCLLLDLGCGSGLSGEAIAAAGHHWLGLDIAPAMLDVALKRAEEETESSDEGGEEGEGEAAAAAAATMMAADAGEPPAAAPSTAPRPPDSGDLALSDLGHGLPVRQGTFDGAVSISAVQWLCNADRASHDPRRRMRAFFSTLYRALRRGARAVLQVYPEGPQQAEMLVSAAMRAGFGGGLVVDYPHSTRAKKYFLVLMAGGGGGGGLPSARGENGSDEEDDDGEEGEEAMEASEEDGGGRGVRVVGRKLKGRRAGGGGGGHRGARPEKKSRAWILKKKEQARGRGLGAVRPDTKYTGRKRHKSRK